MNFAGIPFIFIFMPVFLLLYYLAPAKARNPILVLGSLLFYGAGAPWDLPLLLVSLVLNYALSKWRKGHIPGILLNVAVLAFYKYYVGGALPLGLSFYTFQLIAFYVDAPQPVSFWEFASFVTMFPRIVAGPILRYQEVAEDLRHFEKRVNRQKIERGCLLFVCGLGLKVQLSNQILPLWSDLMTGGVEALDAGSAWLGAVAYSFQLYFDFWGYSLMAVGLGSMLGFRLPENFHLPYCAVSVGEFWRRWHMTLGRWFRDYIYIPLGGSRRGKLRNMGNLLVVWIVTGIWHGVTWNFLIWSMFLFLLICLERSGLGTLLKRWPLLGHFYVLVLIPVSWVLFAINDLQDLLLYLEHMFGVLPGGNNVGLLPELLSTYGPQLVVCAVFITPLPLWIYQRFKETWIFRIALLAVFCQSIYAVVQGYANPFLYAGF